MSSCKKETIQKPNRLIEKEKMIDIMYDLTVLTAFKSLDKKASDTTFIDANGYIYKKYKIDSIQFSQSNIYYAKDYNNYKDMMSEVKYRLEVKASQADSLLKIENKKNLLLEEKKEKISKKKKDTIAASKTTKSKIANDSIDKIKRRMDSIVKKKKTLKKRRNKFD